MEGTSPVNPHVFAILYALSIIDLVFSAVLIIAWAVTPHEGIPVNILGGGYLFFSFLVPFVILGVFVFAGLYLGKSVGLGAPLLEGWAKGEQVRERALSALKIALVIGLGVTAAKYLLDLAFSSFVPVTFSQLQQSAVLSRLAIPFQEGIGSEIVYRLFLMTAIVWVLWKLQGAEEKPPNDPVYWAGIILPGLITVAIPLSLGVTGIAALQYAVIILAGAIPFGWLYWKKGIESALVAHFVSGAALVLLSLI